MFKNAGNVRHLEGDLVLPYFSIKVVGGKTTLVEEIFYRATISVFQIIGL